MRVGGARQALPPAARKAYSPPRRSWSKRATRARVQGVSWLKALLEPYDERGIAVRSAMEEAGLVRDVASVVVFDVQGTWTHEACDKAGFEVKKCAATVAAVREMVLGMRAKGVVWSIFDPIVAAAVPLAKEEGGHLFEAEVLAEAIKGLERPKRLLLSVPRPRKRRDPTAVAVREKPTAYRLARPARWRRRRP